MIVLLLAACYTSTPLGIVDRVTDPDNVIHDYEWFHTASEHVASRAAQVRATHASLTEETDDAEKRRLRVDLSGQQRSCRDLVADYNANAEKVTMGIFRGWSLPAHLDMESCE